MAGDPKNPGLLDLAIDGSEFASQLVEMPPGEAQGLLSEQPGYEGASQEIRDNQTEWGEQAGVTAKDIQTLERCDEVIARLDVFIPALTRLLGRMLDTRRVKDDERQRTVFTIAQSVDRRSRKTPALRAYYEKTRAYRSAVARKAAQTRRRNEEARARGDTVSKAPRSKKSQVKQPQLEAAPPESKGSLAQAPEQTIR